MVPEETFTQEDKRSLKNRYKKTLIDRLTPRDLEEFQTYIKGQYDPTSGWNLKCRQKFEMKLRNYFHEEILRREIAAIETVLGMLTPADLTG